MNAIRDKVRADRRAYECVMAPDPDKLKDVDGNPYWGSHQHLLETMLALLELELRKV